MNENKVIVFISTGCVLLLMLLFLYCVSFKIKCCLIKQNPEEEARQEVRIVSLHLFTNIHERFEVRRQSEPQSEAEEKYTA